MTEVVGLWTGAKAHLLRVARRMTGEAFAAHLGVAPRMVAKWDKTPDLVPTMVTQQTLDTELAKLHGDERARFEVLLRELESEPASLPNDPHTVRPELLPVPALSFPSALPTASSETVAYLRRSLQDLYVTDNLLGPRVLLPVIIAHFRTIEGLAETVGGTALDELLSVGSAYAEFAGWLHHDSGDLAAAATWCAQGLEWADLAGDARMGSFILMRRAVQSISSRRGEYAVRFAQAAQRSAGENTTRVHAFAALTEAHGHAVCGSAGEVERAVDKAALLIEAGADAADGDPTARRYCELPLYSKISQAKCYLELRKGDEAVEAFGRVLADLSSDYRRDRGQYMASLAKAHILAGQPEQACATAEEALSIAVSTGSTRTINDLKEAIPAGLSQWPGMAEAERIKALLAAPNETIGGNRACSP
ncbi:MAG: tetratricopeptide repeat protein [Sciscionella sp.]